MFGVGHQRFGAGAGYVGVVPAEPDRVQVGRCANVEPASWIDGRRLVQRRSRLVSEGVVDRIERPRELRFAIPRLLPKAKANQPFGDSIVVFEVVFVLVFEVVFEVRGEVVVVVVVFEVVVFEVVVLVIVFEVVVVLLVFEVVVVFVGLLGLLLSLLRRLCGARGRPERQGLPRLGRQPDWFRTADRSARASPSRKISRCTRSIRAWCRVDSFRASDRSSARPQGCDAARDRDLCGGAEAART